MKKYFVYTPDIPENPIIMDGPDDHETAEIDIALDLSDKYPKVKNYIICDREIPPIQKNVLMAEWQKYHDRMGL